MADKEDPNVRKNPAINPMMQWFKQHLGQGNIQRRKQNSNDDWLNDVRDMQIALTTIPHAVGNLTYLIVSGDEEKEKHAYYLARKMTALYTACTVDNIEGMTLFTELFDEIDKDPVLGEVWSLFSGLFTLHVFGHIFTTKAAAIGTVPIPEVTSITQLSSLLNYCPAEDRETVLAILKKHEIWPHSAGTRHFKDTLKDFKSVCEADWELWARKNATNEQIKVGNKIKFIKLVDAE